MDVTSSGTLAVIYAWKKRIWPRPVFIAIFACCTAGAAALTMSFIHPVLDKYDDIFKGGVGFVSFTLGAIFLITGSWTLFKTKRAEWQAKKAKRLADAAAAEKQAEEPVVISPTASTSSSEPAPAPAKPGTPPHISGSPPRAPVDPAVAADATINSKTEDTPPAPVPSTSNDTAITIPPDVPSEQPHTTEDAPLLGTSVSKSQKSGVGASTTGRIEPVKWCGHTITPKIYVPITAVELLFIGAIAGCVGFGGGTWFSMVILTNVGLEVVSAVGTGSVLMCATMTSLAVTLLW